MKARIILAALVLTGCATPPTPVREERFQNLPNATEVFELRNKCVRLGDDLSKTIPVRTNASRTVTSNYVARTNRCYVVLEDSPSNLETPGDSWFEHTNLYDGQTRDLLATTLLRSGAPDKRSGTVYDEPSLRGYDDVHAYIEKRMKREE
jgi:hypothetical protein